MREQGPGQQFGNYRITRHLGKGGFADVYLGQHLFLHSFAAIKILHTSLNEKEHESFLNEARIVAHLEHPHIIKVLDFGISDNQPYLVMEFAPHGTIRERFLRAQAWPARTILPVVRQMADALTYAHSQRLVHRDVKPENMLLGTENEVLLSDFGVALLQQTARNAHSLEATGTPAYMAPEQLRGQPEPASDQYALGICVYEWLCGRRPFYGSFLELAGQHMLAQPRPLREHAAVVPEVERVVLKALAKEPQERFPTVQAFASALEAAVGVSAPLPGQAPNLSPGVPSVAGSTLTPVLERTPGLSPGFTTVPASPPTPLLDRTPEPQVSQEGSLSTRGITPGNTKLAKPTRGRMLSPGLTLFLALLALVFLIGNGLLFALSVPITPAQESALPRKTLPTSTASPGSTADMLYQQVTSRTPIIDDPLSSENALDWNWSGSPSCIYQKNALYAFTSTTKKQADGICTIFTSTFTNFALQAQVMIDQGSTVAAGLIFRADFATGRAYMFNVTSKGEIFLLQLVTLAGITTSIMLFDSTNTAVVKTQPHQPNILTVIARNNDIYLYVNQHFISHVANSLAPSGTVGVDCLINGDTKSGDAAFQNARVWQL